MSEDAGQVDYVAGRLEFQGHSPYRAICSEEIFQSPTYLFMEIPAYIHLAHMLHTWTR